MLPGTSDEFDVTDPNTQKETNWHDVKMSGARLNMKHGFITYIKRNQVNRDKYDKEVKAKAAEAKQTRHGGPQPVGSCRVKKPDQQTYVPPTRLRHTANGEAKMPEEEVTAETLFRLEYEDQNGEIYNLYVHPHDDPMMLSRRFGHEQGFSHPMVRAFSDFIRDEMKKCDSK